MYLSCIPSRSYTIARPTKNNLILPAESKNAGCVCLNTSAVSAVIKPASSWKIIKERQGEM